MNKPLRRISLFCGLLVLALLIRTNWLQYVQAEELSTRKENRRVQIAQYATERGNIIVKGEPITGSKVTNGSDYKFKRTYTAGELWAPVTGYASQAFGSTQLESLEDGILTGNDDRLFFDRTIGMFTGEKKQGGNVVTTLNPDAQVAAFEALGKKKGAVAAIDPRTGAILALVSTPRTTPAASPATPRTTRRPGSSSRTARTRTSSTAPCARPTRPAPPSRWSPPPPPSNTASSPTSTPRRTPRTRTSCPAPRPR